MKTGSKYSNGRDIATIAKLVRADVKAAIAASELPAGTKVSVRISRYSMGQSLSAKITAMSGPIVNPARVKWDIDNPHAYPEGAPAVHSPEAKHALLVLEAIVDAYHYDNSDTQYDHFDVNFYAHVDIDWRLMSADRKAVIESGFDKPAEAVAIGPAKPGMTFTIGEVEITTTLHEIFPSNVIPLFGRPTRARA
jgi:hypothetical protein